MKAKVTFFHKNIIAQHLISATKAWLLTCYITNVKINLRLDAYFLINKFEVQGLSKFIQEIQNSYFISTRNNSQGG